MTKVLVVNHDIYLADQEVDSLRRLGYEVEECSGPTWNTCPVLSGHECVLATGADVMVYDAWASGDPEGARELILGLRNMHPDVPIVLTVPGISLDWIEESGVHGVTQVLGQPTGARLHVAIQEALETKARQPDAVVPST
jgi:hypothetical protein